MEICSDCGAWEAMEDTGLGPRMKRECDSESEGTLQDRNEGQAPVQERQAGAAVGTEGTVCGVDDIGPVIVSRANGSGLNVVLEEAAIEIIE